MKAKHLPPLVMVENLSRLPDREDAIQGIALPPLEARLQKRFLIMVQSHLRSAPELAASVASLPSTSKAFAATQATWRFLNNERVGMPELIEPPREVGRGRVRELKSRFALLVHDWCKLSFTYGKRDLTQLTHATDIGYELTTALLVSTDNGSPFALMEMHLKTAVGGDQHAGDPHSRSAPSGSSPADDGGKPRVGAGQVVVARHRPRSGLGWDYFRKWDAAGFKFLVRADDRRVQWSGKSVLLSEIRRSLTQGEAFHKVTDEASYHGKAAQLWVSRDTSDPESACQEERQGKAFPSCRTTTFPAVCCGPTP